MVICHLAIRRVFESSGILPKIMATNNDKSLELQTLGTADDELEYHIDNDSEQENSDCEIIHETVCIQLHHTNSLEEKQPKQSEEMAVKQYEDKKEKVEKIDADKAETSSKK